MEKIFEIENYLNSEESSDFAYFLDGQVLQGKYTANFIESFVNSINYRIECTKKIKKILLKINYNESKVFYFLKNPDEEICIHFLSYNSNFLKYIENQTVQMCYYAIVKNPELFDCVRIVPNPDFETTLSNLKKKQLVLESI